MDETARQIFVTLLAIVMIFGTVVLPLASIMSRDVPKEDFKRDVRKGL